MKRDFTKQLLNWKNNQKRKPLLVKGIRQAGKTYSISKFGKQHFPNMHSINFEQSSQFTEIFTPDLNPIRIIEELSFALNTTIDINNDLVFFDEIQACPRAITSLKYFQEHLPQLALCAAGSLLSVQLNQEPFPVGKVDMLEIFPMSFCEFLLATGDNKSVDFLKNLTKDSQIPKVIHDHLWKQMINYFIVGGLPEVVATYIEHKDFLLPKTFELVRIKQSELITAYNADMAKHAGKVNAMHINRVWKSIPAQLAKTQNHSSKYVFKGVVPGKARFSQLADAIDWLEAAGLIIKVHIVNSGYKPFSAFSKENTFKLFLSDIGLLGALSDLSAADIYNYNYGSYKGYFAENFAAQEFRASGIRSLYSWQENRSEIEFLLNVKGNVIPIEIKSGWVTQAKSLKVFADKYQPSYRTIFSGHNLKIDTKNKIHAYPLYLAGKFPLV